MELKLKNPMAPLETSRKATSEVNHREDRMLGLKDEVEELDEIIKEH